jgi:hypothetical protein
MLEAGRSPIRIPVKVDFFSLLNTSSRTTALGSTRPLTGVNTRDLSGGKGRSARRADNVDAICEPNVWKCGYLNFSQTLGPLQG